MRARIFDDDRQSRASRYLLTEAVDRKVFAVAALRAVGTPLGDNAKRTAAALHLDIPGASRRQLAADARERCRDDFPGTARGTQCIGEIEQESAAFLACARRLQILATRTRHRERAAYARMQLAGREWLREVIVDTGVDALDARILARTGRKEDHRKLARGRAVAQGLQKTEAVEPRHHHVGEHEIGRRALDFAQCLEAVGRGSHMEARRQKRPHVFPHVGVVIDEQHRIGVGGRQWRAGAPRHIGLP